MVSTDKLNCNILAHILKCHGINRIFASPGSRNAPLLVAFSRLGLNMEMVVDERSAAFIGLGAAIESGEPVALCCTSGTALLNYAPAVAEAYYRGVPLIVISADRPEEWIDQDDSQTIRQPGVLNGITKACTDIPASLDNENTRWMAEREINDAIAIAYTPQKGPVHINIRIDAPLGRLAEYQGFPPRVISSSAMYPAIDESIISKAVEKLLTTQKVMIVAGFMAPDSELSASLEEISRLKNVAVLTETTSNLHGENFIPAIDLALNQAENHNDIEIFRPTLVITLGGALVSRKIKAFLRSTPILEHWHVGITPHFVDCFKHLTMAVNTSAKVFFSRIAKRIDLSEGMSSTFGAEWRKAYHDGLSFQQRKIRSVKWTDLKAFDTLLSLLPSKSHIHFSNGTPIRYSQLFGYIPFERVDCNRGVSGIDGCTSTALGASLAAPDGVILISGDTSFQYDIAALSSLLLSSKLKMVVIMNSGGAIFRFIESTSRLPEREKFFGDCVNLPIEKIAEVYNIRYMHVTDNESLRSAIPEFLAENNRPMILAVETPTEESAELLRSYFERK